MVNQDAEAQAAAMPFIVALGAALTQAGTAVDEVEQTLLTVADRLGLREANVLVLPTAVMLQTGDHATTSSRLTSFRRSWLRLDQINALDLMTRQAERGQVTPVEGLRRLAEIAAARPPLHWTVRVLGMGLLSVGFGMLLQPSAAGLVLAFVLGLVVGALRVVDLPRLQAVLPVVATFGVSLVVFEAAVMYGLDNPLRMVIPPLVLFLPGAALTTGTMELASGETISGSSRLVEGIVHLLLLAFGILAASQLVALPEATLIGSPITGLGWLVPLIGLLVITLGHYLHNCAPLRSLGWILLVSCAAFAGQAAGAALVSPELSGFFGAVVMTPLILWLSRRPDGPPKMTLFLPAFWVLV
ncbi:MAG: threonine/serine exporter family protein, partial [Cellulomonadaceae bacterium]|nr:threonine/serine exporter family protein [Cellulomonadaceae bacterium]